MTPQNEVTEFCERHDACSEGREFAANFATMAEVWDACERADWLVWIYHRAVEQMDERALRLFACWCVRETPLKDGRKVWDLLTDERSRNAVVVAERFARGEATEGERAQARAAAAYADAAYAAAAYAYAAYAAAVYAAHAASYATAARDAQKVQADEFRRRFTNPFRK